MHTKYSNILVSVKRNKKKKLLMYGDRRENTNNNNKGEKWVCIKNRVLYTY